ncbi:hypothetical protein SAMN05216464_111139 [Mucilaginibacter pineti]|uniref:Uncharacterized protein n=1 Tax=Mucilaginibacter pineti TaxID=1391627 RepID=A0A1G7HBB0_9SPHI|nr:hypothetical protein [Mucilaginibacter pineti]SDE97399.1 hypothetical protein SAMN05216464_111139 [Mucilaginibacter pineti]
MNSENGQPLSTQGDTNEKEEQLGGTTNLSADQLKEEDNAAVSTEKNPDNIENPDDLHEIQAGDDLDEPDTEDYQPDENEDQSANDTDGNGGYSDETNTLKQDDQNDVT